MGATATDVDADIDKDLTVLAGEVVADVDMWMDHPNPQLGGVPPRQLIEDGRSDAVRNLLRGLKYGMFT